MIYVYIHMQIYYMYVYVYIYVLKILWIIFFQNTPLLQLLWFKIAFDSVENLLLQLIF